MMKANFDSDQLNHTRSISIDKVINKKAPKRKKLDHSELDRSNSAI